LAEKGKKSVWNKKKQQLQNLHRRKGEETGEMGRKKSEVQSQEVGLFPPLAVSFSISPEGYSYSDPVY
jgi:hypothetical protein